MNSDSADKNGETPVGCLGSTVDGHLFPKPLWGWGVLRGAPLSVSVYLRESSLWCVFRAWPFCVGGACPGSPPARGRGCLKAWGPPDLPLADQTPPLALLPEPLVPRVEATSLPGFWGCGGGGRRAREPPLCGSPVGILYGAAVGRSPLALPSFSLVLNG